MQRSCGLVLVRVLVAVASLFCSSRAFASEVIVPDGFPTITAAIASGADTVSVRPGTYAEAVSVTRGLTLRGLCADGSPAPGCAPADLPVINSLDVVLATAVPVRFLGLHVLGSAVVHPKGGGYAWACVLDAGLLVGGDGQHFDVLDCRATGTVDARAYGSTLAGNVIVGGSLRVNWGAQGQSFAHDNQVFGPADVGIGCGSDCSVGNNLVRGCVVGISAPTDANSSFSGNRIEDCSGTGFLIEGRGIPPNVTGNTVRRCGGRGFDLGGFFERLEGLVADSTGLDGIVLHGGARLLRGNVVHHAGGAGISTPFVNGQLRDNRVVDTVGPGILVTSFVDTVSGNVVGRAQGGGIIIAGVNGGYRIRGNTLFMNGGAGLSLVGGIAAEVDSITNNIGMGGETGFQWADGVTPISRGHATPRPACNDWFANSITAVSGATASPFDVALDPGFCALASDDVTLASDSPLLSLPGCGRVGALGVGCPANGPTAALVSLVSAVREGERIDLVWSFGGAPGTRLTVERTSDRTSWSPLASVSVAGDGAVHFSDAGALAGVCYGYRLAWEEAGLRVRAGEAFVMSSGPAVLAVRVLDSRGGAARLAVWAPAAGEAWVELFDVAGRRVAEARPRVAAGETSLVLGRSLVPGLYLVRASLDGAQAHARLVLAR